MKIGCLIAQGVAPLDLVEYRPVSFHQGSFEEESFRQGRLDMANSFPVGGAEVGAERKSYLEEQVVSKDVGESPCHIGMLLDLAKA